MPNVPSPGVPSYGTQPPPEPPDRHDPYAAFRLRDYRLYALGNAAGTIGWQMVGVAVGWELYARTDSKTALGLVGLVQVVPLIALALPGGHLIDRFDRRRIIMLSQLALGVIGLVLGAASLWHYQIPELGLLRSCNDLCGRLASALGETRHHFDDPYVPVMFALLALTAAVRTVNQPAKSAFLPQLVPPALFANAVTWNSSIFEVCSMAGPALGGLLVAALLWSPGTAHWAYPGVYLLSAALQFVQYALLVPVKPTTSPLAQISRPRQPMSFGSLSAGVHYVFTTPILLATLTLDLFAVVLGGAVALLPVFAKDILHVGPAGLGALRAAPSVGAFLMAFSLAHLPPMKKAGRNMLWAVAGFGAATVAFGLSRNFWLSMLMLALTGMFDNISVVVRQTLVQVLTPDAMRGRVSAVNALFIGSSNQIGSLESGLAAAALGTVPSVVIGGVGTILVVAAAAFAWPQLRRYGRLDGSA